MQLQPKNDQLDKSIKEVKNKIKLLKSSLRQEACKGVKKTDRSSFSAEQQQQLEALNAGYEKLAQLRLDHSQSLKDQWESYRNEQRQYRKKDIEKRQVEFDKELQLSDTKRRQAWKKSSEELPKEKRAEICNQLVNALNSLNNASNIEDKIVVEEEEKENNDTSSQIIESIEEEEQKEEEEMITMPLDILELFWKLTIIDIPIFKSELPKTVESIEKLSITL